MSASASSASASSASSAAAMLSLMANDDPYPFRESMVNLTDVMASVLSYSPDKEIERMLKSFRARMNYESDDNVFRMLFNGAYKRYRKSILLGYEKTDWLSSQQADVEILYPGNGRARLRLSQVYRTAVQVQTAADREEQTDEQRREDHRLILADNMLYCLYRIFACVATDSGDREQMNNLTKIIEADLGVGGSDNDDDFDITQIPQIDLEELRKDPRGIEKLLNHPLMNNLLNGAQNLVKPILPPALQAQISNGMLRKQFSELMTNPEMLDTLEKVNQNMTTASTPQEQVRIATESLYNDSFLRTMISQKMPGASEEEIQQGIKLMKSSENFMSGNGVLNSVFQAGANMSKKMDGSTASSESADNTAAATETQSSD